MPPTFVNLLGLSYHSRLTAPGTPRWAIADIPAAGVSTFCSGLLAATVIIDRIASSCPSSRNSQEALASPPGLRRIYVGLLKRGQQGPSLAVIEALAAVLTRLPSELRSLYLRNSSLPIRVPQPAPHFLQIWPVASDSIEWPALGLSWTDFDSLLVQLWPVPLPPEASPMQPTPTLRPRQPSPPGSQI